MNDLPRHTLSRIIAEHGRSICDAPKRVEALLRDHCGAHRREINIIVGALEERVAADLLAAGKSVPREALLARLAARLRDNLAYTPEAARWGVDTWAVALGILSEAELLERARREAAEANRGDAQPTVKDQKSSAANPASAAPPPSQPQRTTTQAPPPQPARPPQANPPPQQATTPQPPRQTPQQPRRTPQPSPQPTIFRAPAPAARRTPTVHPNVVAPSRPPQNVSPQNVSPPQPAPDRSRRGLTLRGCLFVVVLVIVLIIAAVFVVPAVLMILQEEQARPSINEPRIR